MQQVQSAKRVQNVNNTTQGAEVLDAHCASATKPARKNTASAKVRGTACLALNSRATVQVKLHEAQTAERKRLENAKREYNVKRKA